MIKQWWSRVPQGDKRIYLSILVLVSPVLAYAFVWAPLQASRANLEKSIQSKTAQWQQMQMESKEILRLRSQAQSSHADIASLEKAIRDSAQIHGVANLLRQVQHTDAEVSIDIDAISFDQWIRWTEALQQEHQVRLASLNLQRTPQGGMIKAHASFALNAN